MTSLKHAFMFLFLGMLVVSLSGCVRSIPSSGEESAATTETTSQETPGGTSDVIDQIYLFATQTAMAAAGGGTPVAQQTPGAPSVPTTAPSGGTPPTAVPPQPPAPAIVAPTATPGIPAVYVIQKGEFPYCIARRFNVDPGELLAVNGLGPATITYAGMQLKIPQTGRPFPGNRSLRPHPTTYVVRPGDTYNTIACVFGDVDPSAIAFVNGNQKLATGATINIP